VTPTASRRHFLLASGAALAVGATELAGLPPATAATIANDRVHEHPAFRRSSRAYGVPAALLAALSYEQTRWQDHDGRPSSSLGYGPMHLIDGKAAAAARALAGKDGPPHVIDTLGDAAEAAGLAAAAVRRDPAANIRACAALLARRQADAGRPVGAKTSPGDWFASVADVSGLASAASQIDLADAVMDTLRGGGRLTLADGSRLALPAQGAVSVPIRQRDPLVRRAREARRQRSRGPVEAPRDLDVEWYPAAYEQYGPEQADYGNHDLASRPRSPRDISHIVIHDTEGEWDSVLSLITDPTYVSWQYSLRSSDGHIAQHVLAHDVAWHAGNWWVNMHSIGLEHEGFAAEGAPWFSEPMYRTSARLVRWLAKRNGIAVDRAHIVGHDQVPGTTTPTIPGMHWDPGPFWDWEHYFDLLGARLQHGTSARRPEVGDVVRILPGFAGNVQPVTGCEIGGDDCGGARDTNFVVLRSAPSEDAALVSDPGQHQDGSTSTTEVADIAARATAGVEYVVAEVAGDWTAIWFVGQTAWFRNPGVRPTARVVRRHKGKVRAKGTTAAPVYGRCYPEASAYSDPADVQAVSPLVSTLPAGQEYAVGDLHPVTDYYKAKSFSQDTPGDHVDIRGRDRYVQISLGHRMAFVRLADVDVLR
jgi:N-acetyl-anhydromuramyl-L-alanine amidase AmpD